LKINKKNDERKKKRKNFEQGREEEKIMKIMNEGLV
jgi:hypothetical protein